MGDTLYEEAARCPSCDEPGKFQNKRRATSPDAPRGTTIHLFMCMNDRCPDYIGPELMANDEVLPAERNRWMVQVNPDGTVPPRGSGAVGPKAFEALNVHSEAARRARDRIALAAAQDERNAGAAHEIAGDINYRGTY
jgi:hypothetical protein